LQLRCSEYAAKRRTTPLFSMNRQNFLSPSTTNGTGLKGSAGVAKEILATLQSHRGAQAAAQPGVKLHLELACKRWLPPLDFERRAATWRARFAHVLRRRRPPRACGFAGAGSGFVAPGYILSRHQQGWTALQDRPNLCLQGLAIKGLRQARHAGILADDLVRISKELSSFSQVISRCSTSAILGS
jgi:hypothetical protein